MERKDNSGALFKIAEEKKKATSTLYIQEYVRLKVKR